MIEPQKEMAFAARAASIRYKKIAFAARLRQARLNAGWNTAGDFAESLDIATGRYRHWESGFAMPHPLVLVKVCEALRLTPNDLLLDSDETGN